MKAENPDELKNVNTEEEDDYEARQNLLGLFSLLLEIDKRINPHLYTNTEKEIKK